LSTAAEKVQECYIRLGGNISAVARELDMARSTVRAHAKKLEILDKPISEGQLQAQVNEVRSLPPHGVVKRYILTSGQNNTKINARVWESLLGLRRYYDAELLVGTFSYNVMAYGKMSVKQGHAPDGDGGGLWFDNELLSYIEAGDDRNIELAPGLMWAGRANVLPTASRPLSGFDTYGGRLSVIIPHAKLAMESVASEKFEATKFLYTTGTMTQHNYIAKKAGLKAEAFHAYGALLVEVNSEGQWWVRQLQADTRGRICDLDVMADGAEIHEDQEVESIVWGDIHVARLDPIVRELNWAPGGILDTLRPKHQMMHDLIDFKSRRHHDRFNPHKRYRLFIEGTDSVEKEMQDASDLLAYADRPWVKTVCVDSNHDNDFLRWLREADFKDDPRNAEFYLEAQLNCYQSIRKDEDWHAVEWALRRAKCPKGVRFLREDESYILCRQQQGGIEHGMHGHLGVNGSRATARGLSKIARKANSAHTHSAAIIDNLFVAGLSGLFEQGYNSGPSSWSQSHTVTYRNSTRTIITLWEGKWRA
jgi:hypothetical protein